MVPLEKEMPVCELAYKATLEASERKISNPAVELLEASDLIYAELAEVEHDIARQAVEGSGRSNRESFESL